ncbi:MAG: hypothetical protein ABIK73_06125 [candidate division WOR-3 bacterium]
MSVLYYVSVEIERQEWKGLGYSSTVVIPILNRIRMYHLGVIDLANLTFYEIIVEINNTIDDMIKSLKKLRTLTTKRVLTSLSLTLSKCISILEAYKDLLSLI